ncbi:MAG: DUF309 domain-containing protein [Verrucomicrobiota bacterium]
MSSKSPRIAQLIQDCSDPIYSAYYIGYFKCFNAGSYYEAHDVLEEIWLAEGPAAKNYSFYKGLIQIAGGFVHMKLHHAEPHHRIHSQRLDPAARLLRLGILNTSLYPNPHQSLNLNTLHELCHPYLLALETGKYIQNPWSPENLPQLTLTR